MNDEPTGRHEERLAAFTRRVLADLERLDRLIRDGGIESGKRRLGAEQELVLVDRRWQPAPVAMPLLEALDDPHFTTELAKFNLEINLDPVPLEGRCLSKLEKQLRRLTGEVRKAARARNVQPVLTGILPTLTLEHLGLENLTPLPRYRALNQGLTRLRGESFEIHLQGLDELRLRHPNVMLEACNTSFQAHFQSDAENFARDYNAAQAVAGPVLAVATNSPLLLGRRLWAETRIPLFQQSIDTRPAGRHPVKRNARVHFGEAWIRESAVEIFREDLTRFPAILAMDDDGGDGDEDPPRLPALQFFNGTVYRWNRACYGRTGGKAHLRIENRTLPSGPTMRDEIANVALWVGLVAGVAREYGDIAERLPFARVKENFLAAARHGLDAQFGWVDADIVPAAGLMTSVLLPLAREGLQALDVDDGDVGTYLGVIEERVRKLQTGSRWMLASLAQLEDLPGEGARRSALVAAIAEREAGGEPVARWDLVSVEKKRTRAHYARVAQIMTTDLFTLRPEQVVNLAVSVMDWHKLRHVPVEDSEHRLVGLVTYRSLLRILRDGGADEKDVRVRDIMVKDVVTATPDMPTAEALKLLTDRGIGCLPVVDKGKLVGIVSERDFLQVARLGLEAGRGGGKK